MKKVALALLFFELSACSTSPPANGERRAAQIAELQTIADQCGLPRNALKLRKNGGLRLQPAPETRYEVVDCALTELKKHNLLKDMPMGFVGNEAPK